jgi:hypothetical protein
MSVPEKEHERHLLGPSSAARELERLGVILSAAGLKRASDRGELKATRTADGVRLFRRADLQAFAAARLS